MEQNLNIKIVACMIFIIFLSGCKTIKETDEENSNFMQKQNLNKANELNIDFVCYNMCKDSTKGMSLNQLEKFCKLQCPLK